MKIWATTPEGKGALRVKAPEVDASVEVNPTKRWRRDYLEYDLGEVLLKEQQPKSVEIATDVENLKQVYVNMIELIPV